MRVDVEIDRSVLLIARKVVGEYLDQMLSIVQTFQLQGKVRCGGNIFTIQVNIEPVDARDGIGRAPMDRRGVIGDICPFRRGRDRQFRGHCVDGEVHRDVGAFVPDLIDRV